MTRTGILLAALGLVLGARFAPAQLAPGDLVVFPLSGPNHALRIQPNGLVSTLVPNLPFSVHEAIPGLFVAGGAFGVISSTGTVSTLRGLVGHAFRSIEQDGGGLVILTDDAPPNPVIYRYDMAGRWRTLWAGSPLVRAYGAGLDLATGDLVIAGTAGGPTGQFFRLDYHSLVPRVTTLAPLPATNPLFGADLHHDPDTGDLLYFAGSNVFRLTMGASPQLVTIRTGPPLGQLVGTVDRDVRNGLYVIPTFSLSGPPAGPPPSVLRLDARTGAIVRVVTLHGYQPTAVAVAGNRILGSDFHFPLPTNGFSVSSPTEPGADYIVALSFGFQPGLPVGGGRTVHLAADPLFHWSLTGAGPFAGFQGRLDASGHASIPFLLPRLVPGLSGRRFFAACVTLVRGRISVISETIGVTLP